MGKTNGKTLCDFGLLLLRVGIGVMAVYHGYPKIMGGLHAWGELGRAMGVLGITFAPQFWGFMAAFSEFFGGLALVTGLFMRPFCALLAFTMSVAAFMHLGKGDGLQVASYAISMGIVYLGLIFTGPGAYSFGGMCCKPDSCCGG
jgi:putative oxidoreductase